MQFCKYATLILLAATCFAWGDLQHTLKVAEASHSKHANGDYKAFTFKFSEKLTDSDFQEITNIPSLEELTFYGTSKMTDTQAKQLVKLPKLRKLSINGTALSDKGLDHLAAMPELRSLTFWHLGWQKIPIQGVGFARFAEKNQLESLGFAGSTLGDEAIRAVSKLTNLKRLSIYHTRVTDAGLLPLKELKQLEELDVGPQFSMRLTDRGLKSLSDIHSLKVLHYRETILTWDRSLKYIQDLPNLKTLGLQECLIIPADLQKLKTSNPKLEVIWTAPNSKAIEQMQQAATRALKE